MAKIFTTTMMNFCYNCWNSIIILVVFSSISSQQGLSRTQLPECATWSSVKGVLENITSTQMNCKLDNYCIGVTCTGNAKSAGIHLDPCENPVSVTVEANIPELGVSSWKKTFQYGELYQIPGAEVHTPLRGTLRGFIQIDMAHKGEALDITVYLKGELKENGQSTYPVSYTLIQNKNFNLPTCLQTLQGSDKRSVGGKPCIINKYFSECGANEICNQISEDSGVCDCLSSSGRDSKGNCLPDTSVPFPTVKNVTQANATNTSDSVPSQNSYSVVVQVVVPLVVLSIFSVLIYVAYRHRIFHRIRARILRVSATDDLIIEGEDDEQSSWPTVA